MLTRLNEIEQEINTFPVSDKNNLEEFRLKFISRKGLISQLFDEFKELDKAQKAAFGKKLNEVKHLAESKYEETKTKLDELEAQKKEDIDLTLPARKFSVGTEHLLTKTLNDFCSIFREIGFKIAEGPEVEDEYYNFDALNTPDWHPSRDIQDTYYIDNKLNDGKRYLLRTHTSPIQARTMLNEKPPIRIIAPGRAYRNEAVTVKNYFTFIQVEGLYIDKNVSMRDLKSVLNYFVKRYYGNDIVTRLRPSFFPFTEPSAELDITCFLCKGKGCKACKGTGWIELGGCGMVDPNVFRGVGYDPKEYSGYAFGLGIERIAMMKYGISDIRLFYQNDVRFLDQF
ncbi:MAG: phenylalanine--tRNA ligase subunit alpha [Ignavibacteriae bacterium]|nr:MAG: phenylalanine--tRNA ligase subunit alpha [Ignavibacteriota bacterium]